MTGKINISTARTTAASEPTVVKAITILSLITIILLVPFVNKAFSIDDPFFIWIAKHIQSHPLDPYGFNLNWCYYKAPVYTITQHPPLTSYYMALIGSVFGWKEAVLHIAFFFPAIAVVLGTYFMARKFCARAMLAGLFALLTPVFMISSTTVMGDIMMLAFWVWAAFFWVEGIEKDKASALWLAAVLTALCALTKFYGVSLPILLAAYAALKKRRAGLWALYLAIPIGILWLYQWMTKTFYGTGLLLNAASYAVSFQKTTSPDFISKTILGLSFTGGCVATIFFYLPLLWSRKALIIEAAGFVIFIFIMSSFITIGDHSLRDNYGIKWRTLIHLSIFVLIGLNILWLAINDLRKNGINAESALLSLWMVGAWFFASFINWTITARTILPIVPAVGILLSRALEHRFKYPGKNVLLILPLIPAAIMVIIFTAIDYAAANSARSAAEIIYSTYGKGEKKLWFEGHWGFQYYMELKGFEIPANPRERLSTSDLLVIPDRNTNLFNMPPDAMLALRETIEIPVCRWASVMNSLLDAGFYGVEGPLPFAVGKCPRERYNVLEIGAWRMGEYGETDKDIFNYSKRLNELYYNMQDGFMPSVEASKLFNSRGNAYRARGDYDKAVSDYIQALINYPYIAKIYNDRGMAYFLNKEFDKAVMDYEYVLEFDERDPTAHNNLADLYAARGMPKKAIFYYDRLLALKPLYANGYKKRASMHFDDKEYTKAWEDVRKAQSLGLEIDPAFLKRLQKASK